MEKYEKQRLNFVRVKKVKSIDFWIRHRKSKVIKNIGILD